MSNLIPDDAGWYLDEYDGERFWAHVRFGVAGLYKDDPIATATDDCWLWNGKEAEGYGRFRTGDKWWQAHRVAYQDFGMDIPVGLTLDHLCRVTHCVRPSHLQPVSHQENVQRGALSQKSHCKNGHEFTPANTRIVLRGGSKSRLCITCRRAYAARGYLRRARLSQ